MRRLLSVITSLLLIALPLTAAPRKRMTDAQLQGWFEFYNKTLFANKLPPTVVKWADLTFQDDMGHTLCLHIDEGYRCTISIDGDTNPVPRVAEMTLIHEVCHVYVDTTAPEFNEHGDNFQSCMLERAKEGTLRDLW